MPTRCERLIELLKAAELEACWIVGPENIRYLSGYTGEGSLLLADGERYILTDSRFTEQAERECDGFAVLRTSLTDRPVELVLAKLTQLGIRAIGFEPDAMTYSDYQETKAKLLSIELRAMERPVEKLRRVKDEGEIERIHRAADIACRAFEQMLSIIKPGMTERDIQQQLEYSMLRLGSEIVAFPTIACAGPNGSLPHATPSDRPIMKGELLTLDFGAQVEGYKCDMTRTLGIGKISDAQRDIYETVYQAQNAAYELIKPGVSGVEVDRAARDLIDAKYPGAFGHSLGHGVGLNIHETPNFSMRSTDTLEAGHVMTVEPGIYIPGFGGCRIEDMAIITPNGYSNPITATRELISL